MAALGILKSDAEVRFCAIVIPPAALTSRVPFTPAGSIPLRTIAIVRRPKIDRILWIIRSPDDSQLVEGGARQSILIPLAVIRMPVPGAAKVIPPKSSEHSELATNL
jgi:hypothetical protein